MRCWVGFLRVPGDRWCIRVQPATDGMLFGTQGSQVRILSLRPFYFAVLDSTKKQKMIDTQTQDPIQRMRANYRIILRHIGKRPMNPTELGREILEANEDLRLGGSLTLRDMLSLMCAHSLLKRIDGLFRITPQGQQFVPFARQKMYRDPPIFISHVSGRSFAWRSRAHQARMR